MRAVMSGAVGQEDDWGLGVVEVRRITSRYFGVRVARHLIPRLKKVPGLARANAKSDLFCIEVDGMHNSPAEALIRFKEVVSQAGLGAYFGVEPRRRAST